MPAILNWFLRLLPTNPICMRLVQGGSRRMRHLYIRSGYLLILMIVLFMLMLAGAGAGTFSDLATKGAQAFEFVSHLQLGLICLLTPVFMAGAIAQEANPRTWDILLTTPMNNLQIVLGNMFGRLFFILALLFSTLPLFVAIQYFGGVPGESIFRSYMIAAASATIVAAIAVTLSVTRTAGRRAVFIFYITVVIYLFATYAWDVAIRQPMGVGSNARLTTWLTPLNPFLAMEVLLRSNTYAPHDFTGAQASWLWELWYAKPIAAFMWLSLGISVLLITLSTLRLRIIGAKVGTVPWYRRLFRLGAKGANERPARTVSANPIAWRESVARGANMSAIIIRWGFAALGLLIAIVLITLFHSGQLGSIAGDATEGVRQATAANFRTALAVILAAEIILIGLTALNTSATAVSREREDGTLDILLTTPIQPGPYLYGKLRGLIQFLLPMLCVPIGTVAMVAVYVLAQGLGNPVAVDAPTSVQGTTIILPVIFPEGAIALPLVLIPFIAFCVMVGLQWSIKSKGTIGSVIAAVGIVIAVAGIIGLCGAYAGQQLGILGPILNAFNPVNTVVSIVSPASIMEHALADARGQRAAGPRITLLVSSAVAAAVYILIVYGMHTNMKRTFHMTVRKLAGQK
ncbi:MAG: ABC transporter permease subunit [Phycisphaerales bacterium]